MQAKVKKFRVQRAHAGLRLQNFLKDQKDLGLSGKAVKKIIDAYGCKVNGKTEVFSSRKLQEGDQVQLDLFKGQALPKVSMEIIFENDNYLVVNKPSGVVCDQKTLQSALNQESLWLVHRLDKETSGLLLIAKNPKVQHLFETLFKERKIEKTYLALVEGNVKKFSFDVENFLEKKASYQGQAIWGRATDGGFYAFTSFEVAKKSGRASLMKCFPFTGRTHQIRVHLAESGYPIIGDGHYTREKTAQIPAARTMLHAHRLKFQDPLTFDQKEFLLEPPKDFSALQDLLFV